MKVGNDEGNDDSNDEGNDGGGSDDVTCCSGVCCGWREGLGSALVVAILTIC